MPKDNPLARIPGFLIPIVTTLLGFLLAFGLVMLVTFFERRGSWKRLDSPPGQVVRLLAADPDFVVVETASGDTYKVYCHTDDPLESCWRKTTWPTETYSFPCEGEDLRAPPRGTVDRLETCFLYEYITLTQYALLQDNTLWRWEVLIVPLGEVARMFWLTLCGTVAGLVAGILLLLNRR